MSSTADGTETYTLDAANELQSVTKASLPDEGYTYDPTAIARRRTTTRKPAQPGRITSCCSMGPTTTSTTRRETAPRSSSIGRGPTSRAVLDSGGELNITLYTWDYRDRLTQETMESTYGKRTEVVVYTYDYANRQIGRFDYIYGYGWPKSSSETQTVYDGQNPYLEVSVPTLGISIPTAATTAPRRFLERYLYAKAVDQVLATDTCAGAAGPVGPGDQRGDDLRRGQTTAARRHAREIQQLRRADGGTGPWRLPVRVSTGCRVDPSASQYEAGAVPYDPFHRPGTRQDPIGFASGTTNLTAWCGNDPTGLTDPTGEDAYAGLAGSERGLRCERCALFGGRGGSGGGSTRHCRSAFPTRYRDQAAPR